MDFVTLGDSNYYDTIELSRAQIETFYPDATFYIYDWGLDREQRELLVAQDNVTLVNWHERMRSPSIFERIVLRLMNSSELRNRRFVGSFVENRLFAKVFRNRQGYLMHQKPYCLLDCIRRTDGMLAFLDADAFLVADIDELEDHAFDVAVTRRPEHEITADNGLPPINGGVIFFDMDEETATTFVEAWFDELERRQEMLDEQMGLSELVSRDDDSIFDSDYKGSSVTIDDTEVTCLSVPCEKYNYYELEDGYDPNSNWILHLKGWSHVRNREVIDAVRGD